MKILIVRFLAIGDVVLSSVLCDSLKKTYPNAQIDYLVHESSAPLLLNHPAIDNVLALSLSERKNPFKYIKRLWQIRKKQYDIIIDASSTAKSEFISLMSKKSQYRIARHKKRFGQSYTHRVVEKTPRENKVLQRLDLLQPLIDAGEPIVTVDQFQIRVTNDEKQAMRQVMLKQGIDFEKPIFVFNVSAKVPQKKWSADKMLVLAKHCLQKHSAQIVLFGGLPHEREDVEAFHKMLGNNDAVFSQLPITGLRSLPILFSLCDLFIGNEGGPRHIAEAVGIPTVSIFSPNAEKFQWLPNESTKHQAFEWMQLSENDQYQNVPYKSGDELFVKLFESIMPEHIIPLIDDVVEFQLS